MRTSEFRAIRAQHLADPTLRAEVARERDGTARPVAGGGQPGDIRALDPRVVCRQVDIPALGPGIVVPVWTFQRPRCSPTGGRCLTRRKLVSRMFT